MSRQADEQASNTATQTALAAALLTNWLAATIGTATIESSLYELYRLKSFAAVYHLAVFLSAVISFLLGFFVYAKWKPRSANWIWVIGVAGLTW